MGEAKYCSSSFRVIARTVRMIVYLLFFAGVTEPGAVILPQQLSTGRIHLPECRLPAAAPAVLPSVQPPILQSLPVGRVPSRSQSYRLRLVPDELPELPEATLVDRSVDPKDV